MIVVFIAFKSSYLLFIRLSFSYKNAPALLSEAEAYKNDNAIKNNSFYLQLPWRQ